MLMNYSENYLRSEREESAMILRTTCPCCQELIEVGLCADGEAKLVPKHDPQPRVAERYRGGLVPLTTATRDLEPEVLQLALKQGWRLPDKERPPWIQTAAPKQDRARWLLGAIGVLILMLISLSIYTLRLGRKETLHVEPSEAVVQNRVVRQWSEASKRSLTRFLSATTLAEKLDCVLQPLAVRDQMQRYYQTHGYEKNLNAKDFTECPELASAEDRLRHVSVFAYVPSREFTFQNHEGQKLEPEINTESGKLYFFREGKLDWETFAQHQSRTLERFLESPSIGRGIFRVVLNRLDPANEDEIPSVNVSTVSVVPQPLEQVALKFQSPDIQQAMQELVPGRFRLATVELSWSSGPQPSLKLSRLVCWESQAVREQD
jgi:hypothetical protein